MISMKAKYGFKALARLAQARGQSLLIADVAEREGFPRKFLEHILVQLKPQGIVHSKKGRGSGYMLERDASKISVGDVIRILDGPLAPVPRPSKTAYRSCDECVNEATYGIRLVLKDAHEATTRILDATTTADLVRSNDSAHAAPLEHLSLPMPRPNSTPSVSASVVTVSRSSVVQTAEWLRP
jgi:Rrf2 family protein